MNGCITVVNLLLAATMVLLPAASVTSSSIIIAGEGPELPMIERLVRAFEKGHLGSVVEIRWDPSSRPVELVKAGEAFFAVTGREAPDLTAVPIAWDGIAVVVDFTNPVKEVTSEQLAAMFSGKIKQWSELGGPQVDIQLIDRPQNQHIRQSFEETLGIVGQIAESAKVVRSDQKALSTVAGNRAAVTYGVDVSLLAVDQVEAAEQTVKNGRYKLRRPVLLLSRKEPNPVAEAFIAFVLSKAGQEIVEETFISYTSLNK